VVVLGEERPLIDYVIERPNGGGISLAVVLRNLSRTYEADAVERR